MRLYELIDEYRKISDLMEEGEAFLDEFEKIKDKTELKIINIVKILKEVEYGEEIYKKEIERLQKKLKSAQNNESFLKSEIKNGMENLKLTKISQEGLTVSLAKSPPSCEIEEDEKIPSNLKTATLKMPFNKVPEVMLEFITEKTISKREIITMFNEGIDVPGTKVIKNSYVRIS